ncbi:MAG: nuclear transport factor 2 family protein [Dermatophilaceae bacterium]
MCGIAASEVEVVRRAYAALAAGSMDELERCFAVDAVWHEPGNNVLSGDLVGWRAIRDGLLARLGPLSNGAFRAELVDVTVGEDYVLSKYRSLGEHDGRTLDTLSCQHGRVVNGRIQEVWATHSDQSEVDAFWT